MKIRTYLESLFDQITSWTWSIFLNGLLTILPITLTIALFNLTFKLLKSWLAPIHSISPEFLHNIPHAEILLALALIFLVGTILRVFVLHSLIGTVESILLKVPLLRTVYSGIKQLVHALNPQDQTSFKRVVIVEFPRNGMYSIGFLTNELPTELSPAPEHKFCSVFIPTTPNPTSGFFIIVPEAAIHLSSLTRQEAMALIISGGIILPERNGSHRMTK